MAFSIGQNRRRFGSRRHTSQMSDINVTPMVDVMLVLLVIFMVAAPLATVDVNVDLPTAQAEPRERPDEPLFVTLQEDLTFNVGEEPVARGGLIAAIDAFTGADKKTRVFLRIDKSVDYEHVMELMNLLRNAGYLTIALVGLEEAEAAPAPPASAADAGEQGSPAGVAGDGAVRDEPGDAGEDAGQ